MPRSRSRTGITAAALVVVTAAAVLGSGRAVRAEEADEPSAAGWHGLLGGRPAPQLGQRQIVVLREPSLAERVRRAGGTATEGEMRAWTLTAQAAQREVLTRLTFRGAPVEPEYTYVRVLNGFAAPLDARAVALLERDPLVAGVYSVRAAFPAGVGSNIFSTAAFGPASGRRPEVSLPGFDGRGITVALLDTGVDLAHPFIRSRLLPGIDVVDPRGDASAQPNPSIPGRLERHGTELAGLIVGTRGPFGLRGVAPGASLLPIRVGGWQPDAAGGAAVYARTDQLLAGLEAAVDPNRDGDAHDAARVALVGFVEPFAGFSDGPLARACEGAMLLDTLVVAPAGNDGPAGPTYGSVGGPGGAPAVLTVAASDLRRESPSVHVLVRSGLGVLLAGEQPLGGAVVPPGTVTLPVVAARRPKAGPAGAVRGLASYFDGRGFSVIAGFATLLPRGSSAPEPVREAVAGGARAILVDGALPAGALGLDDPIEVPILGLPPRAAAAVRARLQAGDPVTVSIGAAALRDNPGLAAVAPFSSRGLAFDGAHKPEVAAAGVGLATADPGRGENGAARYGSVSGTSAAAAVVTGAAALLAQARPDLAAAALKAALVSSATRIASSDPDAGGAGMVNLEAAAAVELIADPPVVGLGAASVRNAQVGRIVTLRNVSRRRLDLTLAPARPSAAAAELRITPSRVRIWPGQGVEIAISARLPVLPRPPSALRGTVVVRAKAGAPLGIPWALSVPDPRRPLLREVRLSRRSFKPSDKRPAVLEFLAGRVDGGAARPQLAPIGRLDVELWRGERSLGRLARTWNLLPGRYAFGLTGRDSAGRRLRPGEYELRLMAWPVGGGAAAELRVPFRIR